MIMWNSAVNGKYNEENYKEALTKSGFGSDNWVVNAGACVFKEAWDIALQSIRTIPFVNAALGVGNTVDGAKQIVNTANICQYGFIEGTFDGVHDITDETQKEIKKKKIAQEIIDFAKFYKELFEEENECSYAGSAGSGEITNWRQCDERWKSVSIGSSSVCSIGCTTTAVSYLIAKSGTQLAVSELNPGIYAQKGLYSGNALVWDFTPIAPNMHRVGSYHDINKNNYVDKISEIINTPYNGKQQYVLIEADDGGTHWVAVDHVENGVVYVLDPSSSDEGLTDITTMHRWAGGSLSYVVLYADDVDFGKTGTSSSGMSSGEANSKVDKYLSEMKKIADDDTHGYSMNARNGPDYDCTSFVYYALKNAGLLDDVDTAFAGDIGNVLLAHGFTKLEYSEDVLQPGDIVESDDHATTIYSVDGDDIKQIAAHNDKDGVQGDSSGEEININTFGDYGHNYHTIYRLTGANSSCDSDVEASMAKFIEFLGKIEGVSASCTVRGKEGYSTYYDSADQTNVGKTTAYGITQLPQRALAESLGYNNFYDDMSNGCVEKDYIDKMLSKYLSENLETVKAKYSEVSGGKTLKDYQYYVLVSLYHHWPYGCFNLFIPYLASVSDFKTYDVYEYFLSHTGVNGIQGGLNRREAEYHLLYNGNFALEKVMDATISESYWKKRVEVYNSESVS